MTGTVPAVALKTHRMMDAAGHAHHGLMMLGIAATATALLVFGTQVQRQEEQRRFGEHLQRDLAAIKQGRCEEIFIYEPELVTLIAGDSQALANATTLVFSSADLSDPRFAAVSRLNALENIAIHSSANADAMLGYIEGMPSVERLWIDGSMISRKGIAALAKLPNLKRVHLEQPLSAEQLNVLRQTLPNADLQTPFAEVAEAE